MVELLVKSLESTRSQDLQVAEPIICGQLATLDLDTTLFVLGEPNISIALIRFSNPAQINEAVKFLSAGPLDKFVIENLY